MLLHLFHIRTLPSSEIHCPSTAGGANIVFGALHLFRIFNSIFLTCSCNSTDVGPVSDAPNLLTLRNGEWNGVLYGLHEIVEPNASVFSEGLEQSRNYHLLDLCPGET